jgi:hypothetical protein
MDNNFNITSAQYVADFRDSTKNVSINAVMDGVTVCVPLAPGNRHYDEIQRQVAAGTLTIQDAD